MAKIFLWIVDGTRQRAKSCWSSAPLSRRRPRRRPPPPPDVHLLRPPTVRFSALPSTSSAVDSGTQDHRREEPGCRFWCTRARIRGGCGRFWCTRLTDQRRLWRISGAENANTVEAVVDSATNKNSSRVGWLACITSSSSSSSSNNNNKNTFLYLLTYFSCKKPNDCQNFAHEIECRCQPAG